MAKHVSNKASTAKKLGASTNPKSIKKIYKKNNKKAYIFSDFLAGPTETIRIWQINFIKNGKLEKYPE